MSSVANWSYTANATIWKVGAKNDFGDATFAEPVTFLCDYQGGLSRRLGEIGGERVVKNTVWTEFDGADVGDYLLIGTSTESDPIAAGADEILDITRFADTFERTADDYAIVTGV